MTSFVEDYIVGGHVITARVVKHFEKEGFRLATERPDEKPHQRAFLLIEIGRNGELLWSLGEFDPDGRANGLPRRGDFVVCHYFDPLSPRRIEPNALAFWKPLERLNDLEFE